MSPFKVGQAGNLWTLPRIYITMYFALSSCIVRCAVHHVKESYSYGCCYYSVYAVQSQKSQTRCKKTFLIIRFKVFKQQLL